jgi:hypothetical protein
MIDQFTDDLSPGRVIGTKTEGGLARKGVDREQIIGIDNGALRIQTLTKPGWGRAGIAYGPYARRNGLTFGVFMVNGHNTSQAEPLLEGFKGQFRRWLLGSETDKPLTRLFRLVRGRQRKHIWQRLKQWMRSGTRFFQVKLLDENLAVGWFPCEVPTKPLDQGNAYIMHALGPECGGLWARTGKACLQAVRGLQNLQMYYFVVLREKGAAYYAASIPNVPGLESYPHMRLLAIDAFQTDQEVYAGIHQSVLGQIGFRVDTRVYKTQIAILPEFGQWYGSAHGADALTGDGPLRLSQAELGGTWDCYEGSFTRTENGLVAEEELNTAVLRLPAPSGLVHVLIQTTHKPVEGIGLLWRFKDEDNYWCIEVGNRQSQLLIKEDGVWRRFPATREHCLSANALNSLQVSDDGENIRIHLNGALVYGTSFSDARLHDGTGVGLRVTSGGCRGLLRALESHPRTIPIPEALNLGKPWVMEGNHVAVKDDFEGAPADLAGRVTHLGGRVWDREIGQGIIQLTGAGAAKVVATIERPCPGRTAYTVGWENPEFADVGVRITPPGTQRGNRERGRGGLIFWQDARNYITLSVYVDDWYGTSIAAFFHVDGVEELYDAVWTNVGRRIHWGIPYDFRVVFDGKRFLAFVNGEPVLYRALSDVYADWTHLSINRVGIVANWEWGNDTGSIFQNFAARDRV